MSQRSDSRDDGVGNGRSGGLGGFLRDLLSGIAWSESLDDEETFTLPRPSALRISIYNANGKTRVVGEERDDVEVFATRHARAESTEAAADVLEQIEITTSEVGGQLQLEVEAPRRWNRHGHAHLLIRLPREVAVEVVAANGKVSLEGLRSSVHARSSNGPVSITDVVGDVEVFTSNAKVTCDCTCGRLKARSSNSKIHLAEHRGSIDASTSNGIIHAELSELGSEGVTLATSNGRIVLELPEDANAEVDVRVENGVIRNSRDVDTSGSEEKSGRLRGRIGRGGCPIRLRTSNGTISVR